MQLTLNGRRTEGRTLFAITLLILCSARLAFAQEQSSEDLAKKLQNPVASLISFPLQSNFDFRIGPSDEGWRYTLNIQPVIPISIGRGWNLIVRTIIPVIHQEDVFKGPGLSFEEDIDGIPVEVTAARDRSDVCRMVLATSCKAFSFLRNSLSAAGFLAPVRSSFTQARPILC
jgi:hypothetical protein